MKMISFKFLFLLCVSTISLNVFSGIAVPKDLLEEIIQGINQSLDDSKIDLAISNQGINKSASVSIDLSSLGSGGFRGKITENVLAKILQIFPNIEHLDLTNDVIGEAGAKIIAKSANSLNLRSLNLAGNRVGIIGAKAIIESPNLVNLTSLNFWGNFLGNEVATIIANSKYMSNLNTLVLGYNSIEAEGARAIAESPNMKNLTKLDLAENEIGLAGAESIAVSPNMANLAVLNLDKNEIGVAGVRAVAGSEHMSNLTSLDLSANWFEGPQDSGVKLLIESPYLRKLEKLRVVFNRIDSRGKQAIKTAYPNLKRFDS